MIGGRLSCYCYNDPFDGPSDICTNCVQIGHVAKKYGISLENAEIFILHRRNRFTAPIRTAKQRLEEMRRPYDPFAPD